MVALEEIVIVLLPPVHSSSAPTQPIRYCVVTRAVISAPVAPEPATLHALILETGVTVTVVGGFVVSMLASTSRALILLMIGAASCAVPPSSTTAHRAPSRAASVTACLMFH